MPCCLPNVNITAAGTRTALQQDVRPVERQLSAAPSLSSPIVSTCSRLARQLQLLSCSCLARLQLAFPDLPTHPAAC
jgi:hypothetical protein